MPFVNRIRELGTETKELGSEFVKYLIPLSGIRLYQAMREAGHSRLVSLVPSAVTEAYKIAFYADIARIVFVPNAPSFLYHKSGSIVFDNTDQLFLNTISIPLISSAQYASTEYFLYKSYLKHLPEYNVPLPALPFK